MLEKKERKSLLKGTVFFSQAQKSNVIYKWHKDWNLSSLIKSVALNRVESFLGSPGRACLTITSIMIVIYAWYGSGNVLGLDFYDIADKRKDRNREFKTYH